MIEQGGVSERSGLHLVLRWQGVMGLVHVTRKKIAIPRCRSCQLRTDAGSVGNDTPPPCIQPLIRGATT